MKTLKKYANLALLSAILITTVPTFTMQPDQVVDKQTVWYQKPAIKYGLAAIAGLAALYTGFYCYKNMSAAGPSLYQVNWFELEAATDQSGSTNSTCGGNVIYNSRIHGSVIQSSSDAKLPSLSTIKECAPEGWVDQSGLVNNIVGNNKIFDSYVDGSITQNGIVTKVSGPISPLSSS